MVRPITFLTRPPTSALLMVFKIQMPSTTTSVGEDTAHPQQLCPHLQTQTQLQPTQTQLPLQPTPVQLRFSHALGLAARRAGEMDASWWPISILLLKMIAAVFAAAILSAPCTTTEGSPRSSVTCTWTIPWHTSLSTLMPICPHASWTKNRRLPPPLQPPQQPQPPPQ